MSKQSKTIAAPQHSTDTIEQIAARVKHHQRRLYIVGVLALVSTIAILSFRHYQQQQNTQAQSEMFQAVYYFEAGEFDKALHGDGVYAGLLDIVNEYQFTQAAKLACFYVGVSYMHQKDYKKAIEYLSKFKTNDLLLLARAWALIGDAYTEQGNYKEAAHYYRIAADRKPNKSFTPAYLVKAAGAYEAHNSLKAALGCYERIVKDFPDSEYYREASKHVARLKAMNAEE